MLCPELFLKIFSVLGLRKIVIIKVVVEAEELGCAGFFLAFAIEHFASNLLKESLQRKYKRFGFGLTKKRATLVLGKNLTPLIYTLNIY